ESAALWFARAELLAGQLLWPTDKETVAPDNVLHVVGRVERPDTEGVALTEVILGGSLVAARANRHDSIGAERSVGHAEGKTVLPGVRRRYLLDVAGLQERDS